MESEGHRVDTGRINAGRADAGLVAAVDFEVLATQALTLRVLLDRLEQASGDHPHLVTAAARLAPRGGPTEADRARTAARQILRPVARVVFAEVLRRSAPGSAAPPLSGTGLSGTGEPLAADSAAAGGPDRSGEGAPTLIGDVRDVAGRPVARAVVVLLDPHGTVLQSGSTSQDGTYRLVLPSSVTAGAPGTVTAHADGFEPAATEVPASGAARLLTLRGRARLAGHLRLPRGALPPPTRILVLDRGGTVVARTDTDEAGCFTVTGLGPGSYTVAATGGSPAAEAIDLASGAAGTVDLFLPSPPRGPTTPSPRIRPEVP